VVHIKRKRPRTCVGCHRESPKKDLIRVVRTPDGSIAIDPTGKMSGRGAYVCLNRECIEEAQKRKALSKVLKCNVDERVYIELLSLLEQKEKGGDSLIE